MKMIHVLLAALAGGAIVAGLGKFTGPSASESTPAPMAPAAPAAAPAAADGVHANPGAPAAAEQIGGEVLETLDVPSYTYVRVGEKGSEGSWAAVPTSKVKVGERVVVANAVRMVDFASTTLKKTFPVIYFGTLGGPAAPHGATGEHGGGADPHAGSAPDHAGSADPHATAAQTDVPVKKVDRAPGPNGKTVAEIVAQRTELVGKTVRLRATVVKSNAGILGHTYLHVRDGSGDAANGSNDLSVTTVETPAVGDTLLLEGVIAIDRDIGAGYKFPTMLEGAKVVTP